MIVNRIIVFISLRQKMLYLTLNKSHTTADFFYGNNDVFKDMVRTTDMFDKFSAVILLWLLICIYNFSTNWCLNVPVSRTAVSGILLRNRWIVQHGHSFNTQQHSQAPCNHVVEYNGAVGGEEKNKVMRPSSHYMLSFFILRIFSPHLFVVQNAIE